MEIGAIEILRHHFNMDELSAARLKKEVARLTDEVKKWESRAMAYRGESQANERRAQKAEMILRGLLTETAPHMPTTVIGSRLDGVRQMAAQAIEGIGEDRIEAVLDLFHDVWDAAQIYVTDHHDKYRVEALRIALQKLNWKGRMFGGGS
jgi:hypothetical protein